MKHGHGMTNLCKVLAAFSQGFHPHIWKDYLGLSCACCHWRESPQDPAGLTYGRFEQILVTGLAGYFQVDGLLQHALSSRPIPVLCASVECNISPPLS